MEGREVSVIMPLLKDDTISRNGYVIPKDVFEKALEEWKQKGMPSVEIRHNN